MRGVTHEDPASTAQMRPLWLRRGLVRFAFAQVPPAGGPSVPTCSTSRRTTYCIVSHVTPSG